MIFLVAAIFALTPPPEAVTTVESSLFDVPTAGIDANGWDCVNPKGRDSLRLHVWSKMQTEALVVDRWQDGRQLESFRSSCGPDFIGGSSTSSNLTSDLCDSWRLYLKLDKGSTTRAKLDLDWRGQKFRGYRCEKALGPERG
jgi:hypothetical protein